MKTLSLFQEFDVSVYEADTWEFGTHKHSFFELIYILNGSGTHTINNNGYRYASGNLYFLTPNDEHSFEIKTHTSFCVISFNRIYFSKEKSNQKGLIDFSELFKKIEVILFNTSHLQQNIFDGKEERRLLDMLIKTLVAEVVQKKLYFETIVQNTVFTMLSLIARKVKPRFFGDKPARETNSDIDKIVFYIQRNIYDKEKLKISNLSDVFCKSRNYLSDYFKTHTSLSIKDYMLDYKLNLVKSRLEFSTLTISEIANELGFTDESHLNKIFKSRHGKTAKEYRKRNQNKKPSK